MNDEEQAINEAEARIAEADKQDSPKGRYDHLRAAHRDQAKQAVLTERQLVTEREEVARLKTELAALTIGSADRNMRQIAKTDAAERRVESMAQEIEAAHQLVGHLVHKLGGRVELTDEERASAPRWVIASWPDVVNAHWVYAVYPALPLPLDDDELHKERSGEDIDEWIERNIDG